MPTPQPLGLVAVLALLLALCLPGRTAHAQVDTIPYTMELEVDTFNPYKVYHGMGLRFGTEFNLLTGDNSLLLAGPFSNVVVGMFYKRYQQRFGLEASLNLEHKTRAGLPVFMADFADGQNVELTAIEAELRVGPRFWQIFYPKMGLALGYRFTARGFTTHDDPSNFPTTSVSLDLPIGATVDFPTSFGSTGLGLMTEIGLLDIVGDQGFDRGGKLLALQLEIHVMYRFGK